MSEKEDVQELADALGILLKVIGRMIVSRKYIELENLLYKMAQNLKIWDDEVLRYQFKKGIQ